MVVDALSRRYNLLSILEAKVLVQAIYKEDPDVKPLMEEVLKDGLYTIQE